MLQLNSFIFPLFSAAQGENMLRIQRFVGCGFWLDQYGHFATCKHVLDLVPEGQGPVVAQPGTERSDHFYPVQGTISHADFDIAVGRASPKAVGGVLPHYTGPMGLGLDVQAFGYTDSGKVAEGASKYREVAYRIYEYGIAHRISDFDKFFAECGVGSDREV